MMSCFQIILGPSQQLPLTSREALLPNAVGIPLSQQPTLLRIAPFLATHDDGTQRPETKPGAL